MTSNQKDVPINLENIVLNENAYFFKKKGKLTKTKISEIFRRAINEVVLTFVK